MAKFKMNKYWLIIIGVLVLFYFAHQGQQVPQTQTIAGEMRQCSEQPDFTDNDVLPGTPVTCPSMSLMNVYAISPTQVYLYERPMNAGESWIINKEYPSNDMIDDYTKYGYECYYCPPLPTSCQNGQALCWSEFERYVCDNGVWESDVCGSELLGYKTCSGTPGAYDATCDEDACVPKFIRQGDRVYDARRCPSSKEEGGSLCTTACSGETCAYLFDWNYKCGTASQGSCVAAGEETAWAQTQGELDLFFGAITLVDYDTGKVWTPGKCCSGLEFKAYDDKPTTTGLPDLWFTNAGYWTERQAGVCESTGFCLQFTQDTVGKWFGIDDCMTSTLVAAGILIMMMFLFMMAMSK